MFKVVIVVLSLASQQPVGFAVSQLAWPSEKECSEHLIGAISETAQKINNPNVTYKGKCVDAAMLDKLLAKAQQQQERQNPNAIVGEERVD
jgi:hypothetical protein